jgi:hypothetical protein
LWQLVKLQHNHVENSLFVAHFVKLAHYSGNFIRPNIGFEMSNLTSFALASIFSLLSIWGFYL